MLELKLHMTQRVCWYTCRLHDVMFFKWTKKNMNSKIWWKGRQSVWIISEAQRSCRLLYCPTVHSVHGGNGLGFDSKRGIGSLALCPICRGGIVLVPRCLSWWNCAHCNTHSLHHYLIHCDTTLLCCKRTHQPLKASWLLVLLFGKI